MNKADEDDFHTYVTGGLARWRRSAFLLCQDWHAADDLVAITITKLYRNWRTAGRADNRDAFAQRVLTRTWLDERRRTGRRREHLSDRPPEREVILPERISDRDQLSALLAELGPRQRAVVVLRFYLDYSVHDAARILGISEATVKSQSTRALSTLRALHDNRT